MPLDPSLAPVADRGLVLLGCGKMGSALLEGWLARGLASSVFTVLEPDPSPRLTELARDGLRLNAGLPPDPAIAVLALKPQAMGAALPRLGALGKGATLFLSIAAGTPLRALAAALGARTPIVRAMPNTPAAIGRGITPLIGNAQVDAAGLRLAEAVLQAVGQTVRLDVEAQMDAVTAVSGSGPAYVFLLIETLAAAGEVEGLGPDLAMRLARATVAGAGRLAETADEPPAQLRVNVTSPGGTTAAALEILQNPADGLPALMWRAVAAAAERSRALAT
ncbi:MAG: pyrroline-5-carboxylate reductase [Rhodobacteraceae bacterium]|nr:pyrroline-5-carboxylate reductase [Paracoccaceae bacterium]